ncbi:unnamed protein product, partial [Closterium sp. NIES-54]
GGARAWPENTMLAYRSAVGVDAAGRDTVATSTDFAAPGASDAPLAPHSPHAPPPDAAADAAAAPHTPDAPSGGAATAAPVLRTQLLEVDVQLTRDQQLVLIHNVTVDETTDGRGLVESYSLEELRSLDAGYLFTRDGGKTFPYRGKGLQIPTLRELFDEFASYKDLVIYLDFKSPRAVAPTLQVMLCGPINVRLLLQ